MLNLKLENLKPTDTFFYSAYKASRSVRLLLIHWFQMSLI